VGLLNKILSPKKKKKKRPGVVTHEGEIGDHGSRPAQAKVSKTLSQRTS
jgi:hypothetical protein